MTRVHEVIRQWCSRNRRRLAKEIGALVRLPTAPPGDSPCVPEVRGLLWEAGLATRDEPAHPALAEHPDYTPPFLPGQAPARPNLSGERCFAPDLPTVLLSIHHDVIPPLDHPEPWSGRFDGTRVHGRGAADTKNNIVMAAAAVRCVQECGLPPRANIVVDVVTDEEAGGAGALSTIMHGRDADEVVVLEPTSLRVHHGHRGCVGFTVTASGSGGHMGCADPGTSPIERCADAIARLRGLERRWLEEAEGDPHFPPVPRPLQLNLSGIHADTWHGATLSSCEFRASLGFLPPRSREQAWAEIAQALDGAGLELAWHGIRNEGYVGDPHGRAITRLRSAVRAAGADPGEPRAWQVSCDARLYARLTSAQTMVFGCGDLEQAHAATESVDVDQVLIGVAALVHHLVVEER